MVLLWYILTWRDAIDHTKDHTRAMKMLEEAGIYVLFVSSSSKAISNFAPIASRLTVLPDNHTYPTLHLSSGSSSFI